MSNRLVRLLAIITVIIAAAVGGAIAAQAASSTRSVHACETSKGRLPLDNSTGRCARGSHAVSINQQGPRGATGKTVATGRTGPAGRSGEDGVGATSALIDVTLDGQQSQTRAVGTFAGYAISVRCTLGGAALVFSPPQQAPDLYIHGTLYNDTNGSGSHPTGTLYTVGFGGSNSILSHGSDVVLLDLSPTDDVSQILAFDIADAPGHLLLMSGTSTAALDFYIYAAYDSTANTTRCQADAQLTPSTTQTG